MLMKHHSKLSLLTALLLMLSLTLVVYSTGVEQGRVVERAEIIKYCEVEEVFLDRGVMMQCKVIRSKIKALKMT